MQVDFFYNLLKEHGIDCFCGVPDSLLKNFCAYVTDNTDAKHHTITANEGNAIGLAAGHYLATNKPALVYMQNSGEGNCVNPLLSLVDEDVYNIPVLLVIGWRGEPGVHDEPQHVKQGKVTLSLLDTMCIKYSVLEDNNDKVTEVLNTAFDYMNSTKKPYTLIVRKGLFADYKLQNQKVNNYTLSREEAISEVIKALPKSSVIVSTTGMISRELYELRVKNNQSHESDFLTVGSMGHASSIALGIALEKDNREVFCFDGDGAAIMHLGAMAVNASKDLKNFKHIIFNNYAHDSVGGQPTVSYNINYKDVALALGYKKAYTVSSKEELEQILPTFIQEKEMSLLEIKVKKGARKDLGRPKESPQVNKELFMDFLK